MSDFPLFGGADGKIFGFNSATVTGTSVTSGAANTKGAFVELVSAINNNINTVSVDITTLTSAANANFLFDIAIGDAGFEEVIIPDLYTHTVLPSLSVCSTFGLPINIPLGVRISARCQSNVSSAVLPLFISLFSGGFKSGAGLNNALSLGVNSADTSGVLVATTTAGSYGSWVEVSSSLPETLRGIIVSAHRATINSWSNGSVSYQVAVGAAGFEEVVVPDAVIQTTTQESSSGTVSKLRLVNMAEGERVSIRAVSSSTNTDFDLDYTIHGVY